MFQLGGISVSFNFLAKMGQKCIHSKQFVALASNSVLILENKRDIRRCPCCRGEKKSNTDLVKEWLVWEINIF